MSDHKKKKKPTLWQNLSDAIAGMYNPEEEVVLPMDYGDLMGEEPGGSNSGSSSAAAPKEKKEQAETPLLDEYGTWMNNLAKEGKYDPVYGRDKELDRVAQILARKKKNNPLLIGEAGVGKTAIVEALAQRIEEGKVPVNLLNKKIVSIEISSLVAGTSYRGQFEEKMRTLIEELKARPDIILYMDEIHTLMGSGSVSSHGLDGGNILKPALARGEIRCIGATTMEEYRQTIEKDGAMDRRFQKVVVEIPDAKETLEILKTIQERYEEFHRVRYSDEALEAAVKLTDKYVTDRFFPDKAIDAMDEAGAYAFIHHQEEVDFTEYEERIEAKRAEKMEAVHAGEYEMASKLRDEEQAIMQELEDLKERLADPSNTTNRVLVDKDIMEKVISMTSGIPMESFTDDDLDSLAKLAPTLKAKVIGQDHVVDTVAGSIQRNKIGLRDPARPIGTFLFLGSSGVGKTHLAKQLAKALFGDEDAMIRIDMSEYREGYSASRLIGSPPGYVGYEEAGQLTKQVKQRPYSVVLFDEIEKAHPDIHNLLLQLMDDGVLSDAQGQKVYFKNTVVIMTSNVGTRHLDDFGLGIGFRDQEQDMSGYGDAVIQKMLKKTFAPEFLNRIDSILTFNALGKKEIRKIVDLELAKLDERLKEIGIRVEYTEKAKDFLAEKGWDPKLGARPLKRAIAEHVEQMISQSLIEKKIARGKSYIIDIDKQGKNVVGLTVRQEAPMMAH